MGWLSIKEVSFLLDVSERAVQKSKNKYEYRYVNGKGRGGQRIEIALESLPQKAQDKYNNVHFEEKECCSMESFTGKQREEADFKAHIVKRYQNADISPNEFIHQFNLENPVNKITKPQLFRWQRKLKEGGIPDLIDQRGGHNRGSNTIQDDAWDYFYSLYMTLQKRSIQRCWEYTQREYPDIPSVSVFERRVKKIPRLVRIYYREGETAYRDALPSMERSRLDIHSNDIWFSDHHLMDVAVKNKRGTVVRPWLTVFFDARSNKVISFILRDKSADATVIKQCLRIGMEEYGIPNELYFDNGKDYREKSFNKDFPVSLTSQLGIGMIYATAYHGQAKTVERLFGTMEDRFCKFIPTYLGKDAKQRPENMKVALAKLAGIAPDIDYFTELLKNYIQEYNNTASEGINMDNKCPDQVYYDNLATKKVVNDTNILKLLCGSFEERTVQKNGVQYQNRSYYSSELMCHDGEKVIINYDPYNLDELNIFDMDMRAICVAKAKVQTPFRHTTQEDIREAKREHKKARQMIEQYAPARQLDTMQIIARNQLLEKQYQETDSTTVIDSINPRLTDNSRILKESLNPARISEEESISATLLKQYEKEKLRIGG